MKFDSNLERDFYNMLTDLEIKFQFQVEIELVGPALHKEKPGKQNPVLLLLDRGAEAVSMKVDFVFEKDGVTYYIDTKGSKKHVRRDSKMRYDMLKHKLHNEGRAMVSRVLFIDTEEVTALAQYANWDRANFWNKFRTIKER